MNRFFVQVGGGLVLLLLGACGGGGGSSAPGPTPVPDVLTISIPAVTDVSQPVALDNNASSLRALSFAWDFGDGQTSNEASPRHSYAVAGSYTVRLKVSNSVGQFREASASMMLDNISALRGLDCAKANSRGWCRQLPMPSGEPVASSSFVDASTGWRVGKKGEIFKTGDAGATWSRQVSAEERDLLEVQFLDKLNGWIRVQGGGLLHTADGGASWLSVQPISPDGQVDAVLSMTLLSAQSLVVRVPRFGVANFRELYSNDAGKTWVAGPINRGTLPAPDGSFWFIDGSAVHKAAGFDGVPEELLRTDVANSPFPHYGIPELYFFGKNSVFVNRQKYTKLGSTGEWMHYFWRSDDAGKTWTQLSGNGLPKSEYLDDAKLLRVDDNERHLMLRTKSGLYQSLDGGMNWTAYGHMPADVYQFAQHGNANFFALSWGKDRLWVSADRGLTWTAWNLPADVLNWPTMYVVDAQTVVLGNKDGGEFLVKESGKTWSRIGLSASALASRRLTLAFLNAKAGFVLNGSGVLEATSDGGKTWQPKLGMGVAISGPDMSGRLQFVNDQLGFLIDGSGRLHRSTDGGKSWSSEAGAPSTLDRVVFSGAKHGLAFAGSAAMLTHDAGMSWKELGVVGSAWYVSADGTLTRTLRDGGIEQSVDDGLTWTKRRASGPCALDKLYSRDGKLIWAWCSASSGELLRSTDGGQSWRSIALPSYKLNGMHFLDASTGWLVGDEGVVLMTRDAGQSWQRQDSGTKERLLQVQFVDSRTGWIVAEQGTVLATGTGGD